MIFLVGLRGFAFQVPLLIYTPGSLEDTRDEILEDAYNSLLDTEQLLVERLSDSKETSMQRINALQSRHTNLLAPVQMPDLQRQSSKRQKPSREWPDSVNQMRALRERLELMEKTLEQHWQDWLSTQDKIICLSVEVLGSKYNPVNLQGGDISSSKKKIIHALGKYEERAVGADEAQRTVEEHRNNISVSTKNILKELAAHEKVRCHLVSLQTNHH